MPRVAAAVGRGPSTWTFLVAPAGYGKTTQAARAVLGEPHVVWLRAASAPGVTPWVADLARGLDALAPGAGEPLRFLGGASDASAAAAVLDAIDEALEAGAAPLTIVVDDLHALPDLEPVLAGVLQADTTRARWLVLSRNVPSFAVLHRPDARVAVVDREGLRLGPSEVVLPRASEGAASEAPRAWVSRLDGWAAGIRLAALASRDDVASGRAALSADPVTASLVDYVRTAVLDPLEPSLRAYVLDTAILPEIDVSLAADVGGDRWHPDRVVAEGLFLERSSGTEPVYRYHDLFREAAHAISRGEDPSVHARRVRRAVEALEARGRIEDAVRVATEQDARHILMPMLERVVPDALRHGLAERVLSWTQGLPLTGRLGVARAWALLLSFDWPEARALVDTLRHDPEVAGTPRLEGERATMDASLRSVAGDVEGAASARARAEHHLGDQDDDVRAVLHGEEATWHLRHDRLSDAEALFERAAGEARRGGNAVTERSVLWHLAELHLARGDLPGALARHRIALALRPEDGGPHVAAAGVAELLREREAWAEAHALLDELAERARAAGVAGAYMQAALGHARLAASRGHWDDATGWLDEAEAVAGRTHDTALSGVLAAYRWLFAARSARGCSTAPPAAAPSFLAFLPNHAPEHVALVAARASLATSVESLGRLLRQAGAAGRVRSCLEIQLVRARARFAAGDSEGAFAELDATAVELERRGFRRLLRDEALEPELAERIGLAPPAQTAAGTSEPAAPAGCPLSVRELEVLRLVATGHTNASAARLLFVAPSTVKKHLENVYARLTADNRMHAVSIAREAGWLGE